MRNVPDVAMESDTDNYACDLGVCGGGWGGTSFAAPRWAGFLALVNEQAVAAGQSPVGFINPAIYAIGLSSGFAADFHDIAIGNNDLSGGISPAYNAVPGYDLVTGWGSPNGQNLINALPAQAFALSASPSDLTIVQGGASGSITLALNSVNGFTGSVSLVASGLPAGVTALFNPPSITGSGTSKLTLTADLSVTDGNATVIITGTSNSLTAATTVALSVNFDFAVNTTSQSVIVGSSINSTVTIVMQPGFSGSVALHVSGLPTGATGTFTPASLSASGASTLTISTAGTTPPGTYPLTIMATSGSLTQTIGVGLTVNAVASGFLMSASPPSVTIGQAAGNSSGYSVLIVTSENGFSSPVTLSATGMPAGVMATFSPNPVTPTPNGSVASTLTLSEVDWPAPYGTFPITVSGTSGYQVAITNVSLTVYPLLFILGASPAAVTIMPRTSASLSVGTSGSNSFNSAITLGVTGLPSGVTGVFSPNPTLPVLGAASSTLTLAASSSAVTGTFPLTLTATASSFSQSLVIGLTVSLSGFTLSSSPASLNVAQGNSAGTTITVTSLDGFSGDVYLYALGLPDGATAEFMPPIVTPAPDGSATATLILLTSPNASIGTFPVTVEGSIWQPANSLFVNTTPINLTVSGGGSPPI